MTRQLCVHAIFSRKVWKKELKSKDGTATLGFACEQELASVSGGFHSS
jgi:hypothetical protein